LDILYFKTLDSTQKYLIEKINLKNLKAPIAILAEKQHAGVGSRDNEWTGGDGNLFTSFAVPLSALPDDLALSSASIYFSYIMKKVLLEFGENIWLKWPNDFYLNDEKVGGTITKKVNDTLVCGIGLNLKKSQNRYSALQSDISPKILLEKYLVTLEKYPKWKQVFSEFEIEFELSRKFSVHIENYQTSLRNAQLCKDGSLMIEGEKVYSLR